MTNTKVGGERLEKALEKAKVYIDNLTLNNPLNNPGEVVSTWGRYFTWDNEKRQDSSPYLFDWSYYNGVVFEGLDYVYNVTKDKAYAEYVTEYLSSMVEPDGSFRMLEKGETAGYNKEHGLDCYKTASILLDVYDITGDERYKKLADRLYQDLQEAKEKYSSAALDGNYYHTWADAPQYAIWLDGIYMAQPFMARYAVRYDKAELDRISARFTWVAEHMYNPETELYFHAANADNNSGGYWARSIGWYIAAMADVMECLDGDKLTKMQAEMKKLIDGMIAYQDKETGMWTNYVVGEPDGANNRLETSATSLMIYGIIKAVNHGWLDEKYTEMAILAFTGICEKKIKGDDLCDICYIGAPGNANAVFYDNEGKGVGPFIMAYAEVLRYSRS